MNEEVLKLSVNLNGIIFRKAEMDKSFDVYSKVFEKIYEIDWEIEEGILSVLGEIGG